MRRFRLRSVALGAISIGTLATFAGCSSEQICSNVLVTRQPAPVNSYGLGLPRNTGVPVVTASVLSEQDDRDAWRAIVDHAGATSGGQLDLLKPPVGYILTSQTGAQLASYAMGTGEYTGPIEFLFSVRGADGSLATIAVKGSARSMGGVQAIFDLATRRLVLFTPSAIDEFGADDPTAFAELGSIERSCFKPGD